MFSLPPPAKNKTVEEIQTALTHVIASLEKFRVRGYAMLIKQAPTLPAAVYPVTLQSINPTQPPAALNTCLVLAAAMSGRDKLRLHRQSGTGQKVSESILTIVKNNQSMKRIGAADKITLARWCYGKDLNIKRAAGFAQIYPVSSELAEKAHLFNWQYTDQGLQMTPKENLPPAEYTSWWAELAEFSQTVFEETRANIDKLRCAGWALSPVPFSLLDGQKEFLDVNKALIDLQKTRAELATAHEKNRDRAATAERLGP